MRSVPECPHCQETGWIATVADGVRRVERCECWRAKASERLLRSARIPSQYAKCSLKNFVTYQAPNLEKTVAACQRFAAQFPAVTRGLCLIGYSGIGKTHLAVSVLKQLVVEKSVRGVFYTQAELLKLIRSTYNPVVRTAEMDIIRPVMEAEVLVLDDLGSEKPSEWVEETMNLIVNTRYNERRPTIITTNYEIRDDNDVDSLKSRVGFRMYSRIHEMCEVLPFEGSDYRLLQPNGGPEDLEKNWKERRGTRPTAPRHRGPIKAQLTEGDRLRSLKNPGPMRELRWPGGKAGRG